jgi:hypothetical protein
MAKVGGVALRLVATFLYLLAFCCSVIILGEQAPSHGDDEKRLR